MKPSVEYRIAALLEEKNIKVSTAESCTGGLVAAALVNVAGISNWFEEGYVTYSNTAKLFDNFFRSHHNIFLITQPTTRNFAM